MRSSPSILLAILLVISVALPAHAGQVLVFAAASLRDAMQAVASDWERATGNRVILSLAGSSTLARQIEAGAPADLFISANAAWVDALGRKGLVREEGRRDLLTNSLVVVAHDPAAKPLDFESNDDLALRLGDDRLAMALVEAVPAGVYGKAALQSLGWWEEISPNVAQADNVRAALALVATGEAPFGIVYATDALAEPRVTPIGVFPPESHPPIVYPMVLLHDGTSRVAEDFAEYLASPAAGHAFVAHGFGLAGADG
ncbi:molybdate ABC transporter substrate-binding protein [Tropicimonas marinistellae]|uniref:molybdate ABC transporter substrate-binding protein n=1 Tax=Tropicimonas marinistellae TaxID=1739787 RepID=UPI0008362ED0|nr:molybdate ABC transporter substrate-binding protein [Tropicimonas marinistellae]